MRTILLAMLATAALAQAGSDSLLIRFKQDFKDNWPACSATVTINCLIDFEARVIFPTEFVWRIPLPAPLPVAPAPTLIWIENTSPVVVLPAQSQGTLCDLKGCFYRSEIRLARKDAAGGTTYSEPAIGAVFIKFPALQAPSANQSVLTNQ
jgi:hypothetical protein